MYSVSTTEQFERSLRECIRVGKNPQELWDVVEILAEEGCLPAAFKPHLLTGLYAGF